MFDHQKSRVEYYSAVLESVFKHATTDSFENANKEGTVEHSSPDNTQAKLWEDHHGLYFKIYPGGLDEGHSSEEARPLSNKEDETTISDTVQQIRSMFGNEETKQISAPQMCRFLRSVYAIIRHPRQRPALKSLLRLELNGNEKRFKNAWNALLFLVRIYYCTSIIVELGSKCKSFRSIKFIPVQKKAAEIAIRPKERKETPLATMKALNCFPKSEKWIKFFEREKTIGDYQRLLKTKRTVHAEVQMIHFLETNPEIYRGYNDLIPYIGCSKKCCFFCDVFRIHHAKFSARGTHETVFHIWALPEDLIPIQEQEWLSETKKKFSAFLRSNLISVVSEPFPPHHQSLLQQSSAALSTAKALQREEIKHSEMPQINK